MAEALAAVGTVASIITPVELGAKVIRRIDEFQSKVEEVPKAFQHTKAQLPFLLDILQITQDAIGTGIIKRETKHALLPVIAGCRTQIELLDAIIAKILPKSDDSWTKRS